MKLTYNWQAVTALALSAFALTQLNIIGSAVNANYFPNAKEDLIAAALVKEGLTAVALVALSAILSMSAGNKSVLTFTFGLLAHLGALQLLGTLSIAEGSASVGYFATLAASWLMAWRLVSVLSGDGSRGSGEGWLGRLGVPALFGLWILILWEAYTRGAGVSFILLPPPSAIGVRLMGSLPILAADFRQTVLKAVLFGFFVGSLSGFLTAILADRFKFLSDGLLPIGNMVSALPIIGIAPVMVIWFGFDWQSKAAVVIVMTFFPMLVNTIEGLKAAGDMERDLMRTYASSHWQTLLKLRLPAAMPFVFNALKINSTLAMIGAIVAEFFGTPVVGMGFRISTEVGRMNLDMVWAEIALAAIVGSLFYGAIALLERAATFWHPSYR
jgi:NitT/TauT family transport system permease protein